MMDSERGVTLIEVIAAAVIGSVIAGGTMVAFVTALNISQRASQATELDYLAQQTMERFRNRIACDDTWFAAPGCTAAAIPPTDDPIPATAPIQKFPPTSRKFTMTPGPDSPADTDTDPDYYIMQVRACANDPTC